MKLQPPIGSIDSKHNLWPIKTGDSRAKTWQMGESSYNETEAMLAPQTRADSTDVRFFDGHHTVLCG